MLIAYSIFFIIGILLLILVVRTVNFKSRQTSPGSISPASFSSQNCAEKLSGALQIPTISPEESSDFSPEPFRQFHQYLEEKFPLVHQSLKKEVVNQHSLLYAWEGTDKSKKPALLMAHQDVVPAAEETLDKWTHEPFSGTIDRDFIWGRGALDDKGRLIAILEATEQLLEQGFKPSRSFFLAFGHDEELGGEAGAKEIASLLASRNVELEYVLDEGSIVAKGIIGNIQSPVALIGIGEKGYLNIELLAKGPEGHSSMPPKETAIGIISSAIHRLERNPFPPELEGPTREMFEYLGPEMKWVNRLILANLWLFKNLLQKKLIASPTSNAALRTTMAATIFKGGIKANILPTSARAVINCRVMPGHSIESVRDHVKKVINDERVQVNIMKPYRQASAISDTEAPSFQLVKKIISNIFPQAITAPYLVVGGTDSQHYQKLCPNIYRFGPFSVDARDLARIHGIDECISLENFHNCIKFYMQILKNS